MSKKKYDPDMKKPKEGDYCPICGYDMKNMAYSNNPLNDKYHRCRETVLRSINSAHSRTSNEDIGDLVEKTFYNLPY